MMKELLSEKIREIVAASLFNKKVHNNQFKLLGVTLIIAYLSFNNKEDHFTLENELRSVI